MKTEGSADDAELIRRSQGGDRNAFGELVQRYRRRLFNLLVTLLGDPGTAEDVTQDALVRAWLRLERFDRRRPLYPWLATIAVRLAHNSRRGRALLMEEAADIPTTEPGPEQATANERQAEAIWTSIETLPRGERSSLLLFYREDLTVAEIATVLGVTPGTVKTWLHRGRRHLADRLGRMRADHEESI